MSTRNIATIAGLSCFAVSLWLANAFAEESAKLSEERLTNSVTYLASDELEGRGPGTKGIDQAADYIAEHFKKLGLKTDLFDGTPFQKFSFNIATELGPREKNVLSFIGPEKDGQPQQEELKLDTDFTPLALGGSAVVSAPLVFVGYGITADGKDWSYDEYAGLDVKDKVVIILRKEPQQHDDKSVFDGTKPSRHALFNRKVGNASEHGAAAVIFVNDAPELKNGRESTMKQWAEDLNKLAEAHAKFKEIKEPTAEQLEAHQKEVTELAEEIARLGKDMAGSFDKLLSFTGAGGEDGSRRKMPVFFCTRQAIDKVLAASGHESLEAIETQIDQDLKPRSFELTDWSAKGEADLLLKRADVKNVIGVLEGEGPLADETIVIGAHYDHLGYGEYGSLAPWTKEIHNGADDNASGTAVLLELAERFATSKQKLPRRLVFIAFSGEERGLLGSAHYTKSPRFALEKTVAMFNLDMVGRLKDDKLIVYGTGTAPQFDGLVESLASKMHFTLTKHEGGFGPSDHSSFYAKKIPVLHLFTGTHSEYHRPSDDANLLNISGMRRIADMVEEIVTTTANAPERPSYVEIKQVEHMAADPSAGDRPYFGSIPDYAFEEEGVALSGVQPGGPADKAGIKGGDVIIKFGDSKVANIEDFMGAMMKYKPGDKVKVGVKRGKETLELEAILKSRGQP